VIAVLTDEDFNARITRGLLRRFPDLDILTAHDAALLGQPDETVVAWAAANRRVIVTHDVNTLIRFAVRRVVAGHAMPGVIAVPQFLGIGAAIADLALIATIARPDELDGQIWHLPL